MKIAILAYYFKPDDAIGAVRPENWANWLAENHDVHVITRKRENIKYSEKYSVYQAHSFFITFIEKANILRKRLRGSVSHSTPGKQKQSRPTKNIGIFTYRMPCLHDFWFVASVRGLYKIKPDIIISTHSPYISIVSGLFYASIYRKTKLWIDYRDPWTLSHRSKGVYPFSVLEKILESHAFRRASSVTTVSNGLKSDLNSFFKSKKTALVYNSPLIKISDENFLTSGALTKQKNLGFVFCYTGTIYNDWQDPSDFFSFLEANKSICKMKFIIASKNPGNLFSIAKDYDIEEAIEFKGALTRVESQVLQREADILVLFESSSSEARGVLTGKVFEYLTTTNPILLVGPDSTSEVHQLLLEHNRLLTLNDMQEIINGKLDLPCCESVDYGDLSKKQLLDVATTLSDS